MKTRKLKLTDIKIESFVTFINEETQERLKGGSELSDYIHCSGLTFVQCDTIGCPMWTLDNRCTAMIGTFPPVC